MTVTRSPCCQSGYVHVAKNPAAITCRCMECDARFTAAEAVEVPLR